MSRTLQPGAERTENLALRSPTAPPHSVFQGEARQLEGSKPMMGSTVTPAPARRVRHEVRDSVAVMLFSAAASCGVALLLLVLVRLGN